MQIQTLILGACHTNCYLVSDENQNAVIIDPADDAPSILQAAQGLRVHNLLVTHGHTDHILALEALRQRLGAPIVISKADAWRLESEMLINQRPYVTVPYRAVDVYKRQAKRTIFKKMPTAPQSIPKKERCPAVSGTIHFFKNRVSNVIIKNTPLICL